MQVYLAKQIVSSHKPPFGVLHRGLSSLLPGGPPEGGGKGPFSRTSMHLSYSIPTRVGVHTYIVNYTVRVIYPQALQVVYLSVRYGWRNSTVTNKNPD